MSELEAALIGQELGQEFASKDQSMLDNVSFVRLPHTEHRTGQDLSHGGMQSGGGDFDNRKDDRFTLLSERYRKLEERISVLEGKINAKVDYELFINELHDVKDLVMIDIRNDQLINMSHQTEKGEQSKGMLHIDEKISRVLESKASKQSVYEALKKKINIEDFEENITKIKTLIDAKPGMDSLTNTLAALIRDRNLCTLEDVKTQVESMAEQVHETHVEQEAKLLSHLSDKVSKDEFLQLKQSTISRSHTDGAHNMEFILTSMDNIREEVNSLWTQIFTLSKDCKPTGSERPPPPPPPESADLHVEDDIKMQVLQKKVQQLGRTVAKIQKHLERQGQINRSLHQNYSDLAENLPQLINKTGL